MLIDVALQKSRAVLRAEPFLSYEIHSRISNLERLALALHLPPRLVEIELRNLLHLVHGERREDDDFVDAITKLRREALLRRFHNFFFHRAKVAGRLRAKTEWLFVLLEALRAEVRGHDHDRI